MNISIILLLCVVVATQGAPHPQGSTPIPIISSNSELREDGSYVYNYKTANDIEVEEEGTIKKAVSPATPEEENVIAVKGKYSYKADDGTLIELIYTADDETGFVAQGAHLPTAPPIPEAIQKALAYIASQPSTPETPARG
ncbi:endocuticle structural glycoprotein ABD-4-like isoform X2 [Macrosteles quadrilineatus]|uniref:endocuticle structural glycoprotein ABD-4-like n=1 Tax=Macrosteles quadrilineatus TaxID=74068 RepID=UPI0023E17AEC|nr:endocuticle structural glycoprotein ABD-4-like isoform X2 [Macrosteles quadrilineatus]XP_054262868.1 endocuticle structural glycoprotein ABD-4-like [Macrosteles quadrilineatus]XP_054263131.1 endocuticle structural glycoprotein ABD-4-like isoform X2 [Macrosteles quadrilineatus]